MKRVRIVAVALAATSIGAPGVPALPAAALLLLVATIGSFAVAMTEPDGRRASLVAGASGAACAGQLAAGVGAWIATVWVLAIAALFATVLGRRSPRPSLVAAGIGAGLPAVGGGLVLAFGGDGARVLAAELAAAYPARNDVLQVALALLATTWLGCAAVASIGGDARSPAPGPGRVVGGAFTLAAIVVVVQRAGWIASYASLPTDMIVWSEAPALVNALKLRTGVELYGPLTDVNSYIYSPGLDLAHHGLLSPFGLDLSLGAHRSASIAWQLGAIATIGWALWDRLSHRIVGVVVVAIAISSSLLAPFVHPDHGVTLCFAVALALVVAEHRMPRAVFWTALFVVPVAATTFKLTGAGVGLGLVLVQVRRRNGPRLGLLTASAVAAVATIPLFDASLGDFSGYAIRLLADQPLHPETLSALHRHPEGRIAIIAAIAVAWAVAQRRRDPSTSVTIDVALVTIGATLPALVAFMKHGGRTNNLLALAVGSVVIILVVLDSPERRAARTRGLAALVGALGTWLGTATASPKPPAFGAARSVLVEAHQMVVERIRAGTPSDSRVLLHSGTAAWIDAGRRDVPLDRVQSATELFIAGSPAVAAHFERLRGDHYDVIITAEMVLRESDTPEGRLAAQLRSELDSRYSSRRLAGGIIVLTRR